MTSDPSSGDLAFALGAFAQALGAERLRAASRIETTVRAEDSFEPLRRAEAAFAAAWPSEPRPSHELVWALPGAGAGPAVSLRAYDARGRLLLSRQFATPETGARHG